MAKSKTTSKQVPPPAADGRKNRNFPKHTLQDALVLPQKIQDEMGGKPMKRLLLADGLGLSPSSTNFRDLLSSSFKYGLTEGTEKADNISLTSIGSATTQQADQSARMQALRRAALTPTVFGRVFRDYANKKLPSGEMLPKILRTQYDVPSDLIAECSSHIAANGRFVDIVREIGGSPHILLDADSSTAPKTDAQSTEPTAYIGETLTSSPALPAGLGRESSAAAAAANASTAGPKPIFVGHGKNKGPLQQLQRLLTTFQIPHKVVVDEANLGRPIPLKVKQTIEECGSAILIFTRDEKLFDEGGIEVWRPSENVVHELGATSFAYGDRIVIFKEKGLHFPTNFQSIGYIEFESGDLTARTADLLKELIGFGLVRVTPTQ
jgi:predicted nucleotide-binding protein